MKEKIKIMVNCTICNRISPVTIQNNSSALNWIKKYHKCNSCMLQTINEHQHHSIVTIKIEENQDPNARFKDISGNNYVKIYGQMTEKQRSDFLMHIKQYVKMLFKEAEAKVAFRKEWDSTE